MSRSRFAGRPLERTDRLAALGIRDKLRKPAPLRLFLLRAHHPIRRRPLIPGRLRLEEIPSLLVGAEFLLERRGKLCVLPFVGIDGRLLLVAPLEGLESRRTHSSRPAKLLSAPDVYRAPDAGRFPRRKANGVAGFVDAPAYAIDPAKAERFIHRFRPGDAGLARASLMKPDEQLCRAVVILLQPIPERVGRCEEAGLHAFHYTENRL